MPPVLISEETFLEVLKNVGAPHLPLEDAVTERVETVPPAPAVTVIAQQLPLTVTKQNIWGHPEAHPVVLHALLGAAYGNDWFEWEAETFRPRLREDFPGVPLSDLNLAKVQACRTLILTDAFWERWEVFLACCMPFNDEFPDFEVMQVPSVAQVLVACVTAEHIRPKSFGATPAWSSELKAYIKAVYAHDGIWVSMPPADFVTPDMPEGLDRATVLLRFNELLHSGKTSTPDTPTGVQVDRMLAVTHYLDENRERLLHQLRLFHA